MLVLGRVSFVQKKCIKILPSRPVVDKNTEARDRVWSRFGPQKVAFKKGDIPGFLGVPKWWFSKGIPRLFQGNLGRGEIL